MGRYLKKFSRIGSLGPTEERGFAIWVGYEIDGVDEDLSAHGLLRVDGWSDEELAPYRVQGFTAVDLERLGIRPGAR